LEGDGHASVSFESGASKLGGAVTGSWDLQGIVRSGRWEDLSGKAFDALAGDTSGQGKSNHMNTLRGHGTTPLPDGEESWSFKVDYGWNDGAAGSASVDAFANSLLDASPDGTISVDRDENDGDKATIESDLDGSGRTFLSLRLTQDRIAAGQQVTPVGYGTRVSEYRNEDRESLRYSSDDHGSSIAGALATALPGTPGDASASATWDGRGTERLLLTTNEIDYLDATNYDSSGKIESHEGFDDASYTTLMLTQVYEDAGDLEVTLVDDKPVWTGDSEQVLESNVVYQSTETSEIFQYLHTNSPAGQGIETVYENDSIRTANFERSRIWGAAFDELTGETTETETIGGDDEVAIGGHDYYGYEWTYTAKSALESALEGIFQNASSSYPDPPPLTDHPDPDPDLPSTSPGLTGQLLVLNAALRGYQLGVCQGVLNGVNGLTDMWIQGFNSSKNLGLHGLNLQSLPDLYQWDFSRGVITHEAGEEGTWSDTHWWSKFLVAEGVVELATGGLGSLATKIRLAPRGLDTATDFARSQNYTRATFQGPWYWRTLKSQSTHIDPRLTGKARIAVEAHEQIHRISNRHLPSFAWFKSQGGRRGLKGFLGNNASFYEEIAAYGQEFWIRGQLDDVLKYAWRSTNKWDNIVGPGASALARRHILSGLPIVGTGVGAAGYSIYLIWNYHPWFNDGGGQ